MNFHYIEIHISYQLSYMHLYLLFPFLTISSSLMWWDKEEEEEAVLGVIVPEGELTKLGHGYSPAPLFPLETSWFCSLSGNPPGLCSFSISVLYSFSISIHFSFCLSQRCAYIVASHSRCVSRFLLCFCLWVWFFCRMLMHISFTVSLVPQRLCIQRHVSFFCVALEHHQLQWRQPPTLHAIL